MHPSYRGALTLYFSSPPTAEQALLAQLVVDRATTLVHRERLTDLVIDATTRARQLADAKTSNREIGVAIGILMGLYKVTRTHAFGVLRAVSQQTHRKLRDIAADFIETGTLETDAEAGTPA